MALTAEDINQVMEAVKAASQDIGYLETVGTLSGVSSLPGQKGDKLVNVPISLLTKLADAAADRANQASERVEKLAPDMESATQKAEEAAVKAGELIPEMEDAVTKADAAVATSNNALAKANEAVEKADAIISQGYRHEVMSKDDFKNLAEKDDKTIYLVY